MDDIPSRDTILGAASSDREEISSRELLCRPLRALRDNRAEAEQSHAGVLNGNGAQARVSPYRPGLYLMMDWVASRLHKAGSAAWAIIFGSEEFEIFSAVELVELETLAAVSAYLS